MYRLVFIRWASGRLWVHLSHLMITNFHFLVLFRRQIKFETQVDQCNEKSQDRQPTETAFENAFVVCNLCYEVDF